MLLIDVSLGKTKVNDVEELSKRLNARVFSHEKLLRVSADRHLCGRNMIPGPSGNRGFPGGTEFLWGLSYGFF